MINCLVVDDEPIARKGLMEHIRQIEFLHAVAECKNALEAMVWLQEKKIDLIFLDIQMPKITGIDLIKNSAVLPAVILTTAYPEYAIEGFELNVLDYLLKPISFKRFLKAALKAKDYLGLKTHPDISVSNLFFFVKCNQKIEKILIADVLYVEGMSNYIIVHTKQKKYIAYLTFKSIEEQLPQDLFLRIHKSYLVSISAIQAINNSEVFLEDLALPISKTYKDGIMDKIGKRLFTR